MLAKKHRYILFMIFISFIFLLSACGELTIKLKSDGSGQSVIEFENDGFLPPIEELKSELEMSVAEEEGLSNVKVREKKDKVMATVDFENISALDQSAYEIPVTDLIVLEDDILDDITLLSGAKEFKESSSAIFVRLPSDMSEFDSTKIVVPGKIVAHSEGATVEKSDTISFADAGYTYVVYEPKTSLGSTIGIIAVVIIVAAGGFFIYRKRQTKPHTIHPTENVQSATKGE